MVENSKVNIKLSDTQLKKLKTVRIGLYIIPPITLLYT